MRQHRQAPSTSAISGIGRWEWSDHTLSTRATEQTLHKQRHMALSRACQRRRTADGQVNPNRRGRAGLDDGPEQLGPLGPEDELGTLNLITPEKRVQAGRLVREGISVTCSWLIVPEITADVTSIPPLHYMMNTGEAAPRRGPGGASDFIGLAFHGLTITHLDSLCHQFWDGQMYNGKPASLVTVQQKATAGMLGQPGGPFLVGLAGVVVVAVGLVVAWYGLTKQFERHLRTAQMRRRTRRLQPPRRDRIP